MDTADPVWHPDDYTWDPYGLVAQANEHAPIANAGELPNVDMEAAGNPSSSRGNAGKGPICQVQSCGANLSGEKAYFRRYHVCPKHLKMLSLQVEGRTCRFCQQCGRFQDIAEFDDNKRSCRVQLQKHNERRRKMGVAKVISKRGGARSQLNITEMPMPAESGGVDVHPASGSDVSSMCKPPTFKTEPLCAGILGPSFSGSLSSGLQRTSTDPLGHLARNLPEFRSFGGSNSFLAAAAASAAARQRAAAAGGGASGSTGLGCETRSLLQTGLGLLGGDSSAMPLEHAGFGGDGILGLDGGPLPAGLLGSIGARSGSTCSSNGDRPGLVGAGSGLSVSRLGMDGFSLALHMSNPAFSASRPEPMDTGPPSAVGPLRGTHDMAALWSRLGSGVGGVGGGSGAYGQLMQGDGDQAGFGSMGMEDDFKDALARVHVGTGVGGAAGPRPGTWENGGSFTDSKAGLASMMEMTVQQQQQQQQQQQHLRQFQQQEQLQVFQEQKLAHLSGNGFTDNSSRAVSGGLQPLPPPPQQQWRSSQASAPGRFPGNALDAGATFSSLPAPGRCRPAEDLPVLHGGASSTWGSSLSSLQSDGGGLAGQGPFWDNASDGLAVPDGDGALGGWKLQEGSLVDKDVFALYQQQRSQQPPQQQDRPTLMQQLRLQQLQQVSKVTDQLQPAGSMQLSHNQQHDRQEFGMAGSLQMMTQQSAVQPPLASQQQQQQQQPGQAPGQQSQSMSPWNLPCGMSQGLRGTAVPSSQVPQTASFQQASQPSETQEQRSQLQQEAQQPLQHHHQLLHHMQQEQQQLQQQLHALTHPRPLMPSQPPLAQSQQEHLQQQEQPGYPPVAPPQQAAPLQSPFYQLQPGALDREPSLQQPAAPSMSSFDIARSLAAGGGSNSEYVAQDTLVRLSLKLRNCTPDQLPQDLRARLSAWLQNADAVVLQGFMRPGCTHLTLDVLAPAEMAKKGSMSASLFGSDAAARALEAALHGITGCAEVQCESQVAVLQDGCIMTMKDASGMAEPSLKYLGSAAVLSGCPAVLELQGAGLGECHARMQGQHLHVTHIESLSTSCSSVSGASLSCDRVEVLPPRPGLLLIECEAAGEPCGTDGRSCSTTKHPSGDSLALSLSEWHPVVVADNPAVVQEINSLAAVLGPEKMRPMLIDLGLMLDTLTVLSAGWQHATVCSPRAHCGNDTSAVSLSSECLDNDGVSCFDSEGACDSGGFVRQDEVLAEVEDGNSQGAALSWLGPGLWGDVTGGDDGGLMCPDGGSAYAGSDTVSSFDGVLHWSDLSWPSSSSCAVPVSPSSISASSKDSCTVAASWPSRHMGAARPPLRHASPAMRLDEWLTPVRRASLCAKSLQLLRLLCKHGMPACVGEVLRYLKTVEGWEPRAVDAAVTSGTAAVLLAGWDGVTAGTGTLWEYAARSRNMELLTSLCSAGPGAAEFLACGGMHVSPALGGSSRKTIVQCGRGRPSRVRGGSAEADVCDVGLEAARPAVMAKVNVENSGAGVFGRAVSHALAQLGCGTADQVDEGEMRLAQLCLPPLLDAVVVPALLVAMCAVMWLVVWGIMFHVAVLLGLVFWLLLSCGPVLRPCIEMH